MQAKTNQIEQNTLLATVLLCSCFWAGIVYKINPINGDFLIYRGNARLQILGIDPFVRPVATRHLTRMYFDYTGAQHLQYVALTYTEKALLYYYDNPGFRIWTAISMSLILVFLAFLESPKRIILLSGVHPAFLYFWYGIKGNAWEDKAILLALCLLVLVFIRGRAYLYATVVIGAMATYCGLTIMFIPIYLVFLWWQFRWGILQHLIVMAISAAVFMIPYFPESLGNWKFRSMHMMFGRPFWYATYLPISNFYFKGLNIVTIWACVGVVTILFVLQKIKLDSAFALIIIAALCLDVYNSINRMLIAIVLVAVLGNLNMKQTLTLAGAMFVFIPLQPYTPETITNFHILIFHIPVTLGFLFWAYNSATGSLTRSKNWEKDDQDTVPALT